MIARFMKRMKKKLSKNIKFKYLKSTTNTASTEASEAALSKPGQKEAKGA